MDRARSSDPSAQASSRTGTRAGGARSLSCCVEVCTVRGPVPHRSHVVHAHRGDSDVGVAAHAPLIEAQCSVDPSPPARSLDSRRSHATSTSRTRALVADAVGRTQYRADPDSATLCCPFFGSTHRPSHGFVRSTRGIPTSQLAHGLTGFRPGLVTPRPMSMVVACTQPPRRDPPCQGRQEVVSRFSRAR
jgi:hypothetical protein